MAKRARQEAHPDLTLTGMDNVLEKLRSGEPFTDKDRKIHDDLDEAVLEANGWDESEDRRKEDLLARLVALSYESAAESSPI